MKKLFSFLFNSVQIRYALSYILIIIATLSFLSIFPIIRLRDIMLEGKFVLLQNQAALISSSLSSLTVLYPEDVGRVMEMLDYLQPMRVVVADPTGKTVYDSDTADEGSEYESIRRDIQKALNRKLVFYAKYKNGALYSYEAQPIVYRNTIIGALYIQQPDTKEAAMIPSLLSDLLLLTLLILIAMIILALVFSRLFTKRIFSILRGIKAFQAGAYGYRLNVKGHDEISQLGVEFNSLAERLQRTEEVRVRFVSDASHELKTPLAGIRLLADSISNTENIAPETVSEFVSDISHEAER
ncbi:MAG: HAMP domain-containing protein, partial [Oscillospiraceae bacterium]|nr:HAMP domain-containing protein [Oscillospiraceae bacterium]